MSILLELALEFGVSLRELNRIVSSAPARYKTYEIAKRRGGTRTIAHPARELKALQRHLLRTKLKQFPVHDIAMAYVEGRGILDNARRHVGAEVILKLDFVNFFPSIIPRDLEKINRETLQQPIPALDLETYYQLLFWGRGTPIPRCLSIGAPTSPAVSNIVMNKVDLELAGLATECRVNVTRYADDITASGNTEESVLRFERSVASLLRRTSSPNLTLNQEKRGLYRRGQRQMVTGLILTPSGEVSLGRERKRVISALIHGFKQANLSPADRMRVKGYLGFSIAVEPDFVASMRKKYGNDTIDTILRMEPEKRSAIGDIFLD